MAVTGGPIVTAVVHQSIVRPQLLMGCDRELFLGLCLVCVYVTGPLGFIAMRPAVGVLGVISFFAGRRVLAKMAKHDPQFKTICSRTAGSRAFYPARDGARGREKTAYPGW